jgi:hypothetical protein
VNVSQGWIDPEREVRKKKGEGLGSWEVWNTITLMDIMELSRHNLELYDVQRKEKVTTDDFDNDGRFTGDEQFETEKL